MANERVFTRDRETFRECTKPGRNTVATRKGVAMPIRPHQPPILLLHVGQTHRRPATTSPTTSRRRCLGSVSAVLGSPYITREWRASPFSNYH